MPLAPPRVRSVAGVAAALGTLSVAYAVNARPDAEAVAADGARADAAGGSQAQVAEGFHWFWALSGPHGADAGADMVIDGLGNVFAVGNHTGLDMDRDGAVDIPGDPSDPVFIKIRESPSDLGLEIEWVRSASSPGVQNSTGIAPDRRGGAYGLGRFIESISFGSDLTLQGAGRNDGYLVRYDADGRVLWGRVIGGPGEDAANRVASDAAGNTYLVGWGSDSFPLDDGEIEFRASGGTSGLLASYDPEGAARWVRSIPAPNRILWAVEVAPNGEVYVTGELEAAADLDGDGVEDLPAPADRDGFIARYDADGAFLGAWSIGAGMVGSLAFTGDGDVLASGATGGQMSERYGPADFDGDGTPDVELKGEPMTAWVARYGHDGTLKWVRSYAIDSGMLVTYGRRIVLAGSYHGVRDLDEDGVPERVDETVDPSLESELAILLLSEDGRPERAWNAPGPGRDAVYGAVILPDRSTLFVTGKIELTADFTGDGEDGEGWAACEARGDIFFARYGLPAAEAPEACTLTLEATRDAGFERRTMVDLEWSGDAPEGVDVYRNGRRIATVTDSGTYRDEVPRALEGPFTYRVQPVGTRDCPSNEVTVGL